jgi:hypothetical protein
MAIGFLNRQAPPELTLGTATLAFSNIRFTQAVTFIKGVNSPYITPQAFTRASRSTSGFTTGRGRRSKRTPRSLERKYDEPETQD